MRDFIRRLNVLPFEVLIAQLVMVSGFLALLHTGGLGQDSLSVQVPHWLNFLTNAVYLVAGMAMFVGIGLGRSDIEAFGLVSVGAGVTIRAVALVWFVGFVAIIIVGLVYDLFVFIAVGVRLAHLAQRRTVILVSKKAPR